MVPDTYKNIDSLYNFKMVIKTGSLKSFPCRICKAFVKNIEFGEDAWIVFLR